MTSRCCLALLLVLPCGAVCYAQDDRLAGLMPPGHSVEELRARWTAARPSYQGEPYVVRPSVTPPYVAGSLAQGFLDDGLRTLNYIRYLAGLPDDLALDATANDQAQHGAVLLAKLGYWTHTPPQPPGMPDEFYNPGREACGTSSVWAGMPSLAEAVRAWTTDWGNLPHLGHRRWVLYPPLQQTALGFCEGYALMKTVGLPQRPVAMPVAVAWPARGLFPVQFWQPADTWSLLLDPDRCQPSGQETVTVTRLSDGRAWTLTQADQNTNQAYLLLNTERFGWAYSLAFRIPAA